MEQKGGCAVYEEADPEVTKTRLLKNVTKSIIDEPYQAIIDSKASKGTGPGFTGEELLSKDELNLIMDLEDEGRRLGQFTQIFPRPSTAQLYYGFFEVKRYANALYCAWLSTPLETRNMLIKNCQKQYGH